jgi:hypothetical protein
MESRCCQQMLLVPKIEEAGIKSRNQLKPDGIIDCLVAEKI